MSHLATWISFVLTKSTWGFPAITAFTMFTLLCPPQAAGTVEMTETAPREVQYGRIPRKRKNKTVRKRFLSLMNSKVNQANEEYTRKQKCFLYLLKCTLISKMQCIICCSIFNYVLLYALKLWEHFTLTLPKPWKQVRIWIFLLKFPWLESICFELEYKAWYQYLTVAACFVFQNNGAQKVFSTTQHIKTSVIVKVEIIH